MAGSPSAASKAWATSWAPGPQGCQDHAPPARSSGVSSTGRRKLRRSPCFPAWRDLAFPTAGSGFVSVSSGDLAPRLFPPERATLCADREQVGLPGRAAPSGVPVSQAGGPGSPGVSEGLPIRPTRAAKKAAGNTVRASLLARNKTRDPGTRGSQGNIFDFRKSQDIRSL